MQKKTLTAMTVVGLAAAISIPTIAFGNARNNEGSLHPVQVALTPYIAQLSGANEVPTAIPTAPALVGVGAVSVTFSILDATNLLTGAQVCFDISYSNILTPIRAHIHPGATGAVGSPVVMLFDTALPPVAGTTVGATSATGCVLTTPALATQITTTPSDFYVNVHTALFPNGAMRGQLAAGPPPAGEQHFLATPLRAYDSRDAAPIAKILPGQTRTISLATGKTLAGVVSLAVPPGATAAIVTLTVTETTVGVGGNGGFLKLYSAASTEPATSSINWAGVDQNVAVSTQVAVDASGQVKVTAGANATHFVIDVLGYTF